MGHYNVKAIRYASGTYDTRIYKRAILSNNVHNTDNVYINKIKDIRNCTKRNNVADNKRRSTNRAKQKIYELAKNGTWDYFVTLTFNGELVNRYDYVECAKKISDWLSYMRKKCKDMVYIFVPEQHKDGAYHFHGLMSNIDNLNIVDSGHRSKGDIIYNLDSYKYGWSTMTKVKDNGAVITYLTKYITKDLIDGIKGKKKYWCSRNILRPAYEFMLADPIEKACIWQECLDECSYQNISRSAYNEVMYFSNASI